VATRGCGRLIPPSNHVHYHPHHHNIATYLTRTITHDHESTSSSRLCPIQFFAFTINYINPPSLVHSLVRCICKRRSFRPYHFYTTPCSVTVLVRMVSGSSRMLHEEAVDPCVPHVPCKAQGSSSALGEAKRSCAL
jgi:hypothetical protein